MTDLQRPPAPTRPNVVWVCADDYSPDACAAYGSRSARTPNLARLASSGLRFDRAFCCCPLSTPSRQSFWTGRYPRSIGVTLTPTALPPDEVTLPALLRAVGYTAASFGKTHYYSPRVTDYDLCVDLPEYHAWLQDHRRPPAPAGMATLGAWRPFRDPAAIWLNSRRLPYNALDAEMAGTYYATRAAEFLASRPKEPFFLYASFYETHSPFWFPVDFPYRADPGAFEPPEIAPPDLPRVPWVFRDLTPDQKRGILASYHTCAAFMDKNVGLVLDALERSGKADNTVVVFTSDHGYLLGQHGRFEKHCCYDPAVRACLLVRWPGVTPAGGSTGAFVELLDLMPTVLEICQAPVPPNVQGKSFVAVLAGASHHREVVLAEYADNAEAMIRTDRWKLIYFAGNRRRRDGYFTPGRTGRAEIVLYDLEADPGETRNLIDYPGGFRLARGLMLRLVDHLIQTARDPKVVPDGGDEKALLEACLIPRDLR